MPKRFVTGRSLVPLLALFLAGTAARAERDGDDQRHRSPTPQPRPHCKTRRSSSPATAPTARSRTHAHEHGRPIHVHAVSPPVRRRSASASSASRRSAQRVTRRLTVRQLTADFALSQRTTQLDQVVVTGTGGVTQRRAVGNVVETIDAKSVLEVAPARSVEQLIGARTPGLIVLPSTGQVGTGAQLRVRAASSLSLSNDPIIYIDGVRMDASAARGPVQRGGAGASRLNDINPEDIETIEVIKGPAAATLYGTEASNGVIQIITKRGKSGKAQFAFSDAPGRRTGSRIPKDAPACLYAPGTNGGPPIGFNLYKHEVEQGKGPIFSNGKNQGYSGTVPGGTDATRYYLSGNYDNDVGVVVVELGPEVHGPRQHRHRGQQQASLRGKPRPHPRSHPARAERHQHRSVQQSRLGQSALVNTATRGFSNTPPEEWKDVEGHADNDRTTLSFTGDYNPFSWFTNRLVTGLDVNSENNSLLYPRTP